MKLENSMIAEFFARQEPKTPRRARIASLLLCLASAIVVSGAGSGAIADEQAGSFATVCALKETKVVTLIEDHGSAEDLPSDSLSDAALAMLRARSACYEGRVGEALALYDSILNLGPVVSVRKP
jgi:hypothetical protein